MTRSSLLWLAATGCAVTLAAAVPQAGPRSPQAPAAKSAAPAPAAAKVDPRVAKLKDQVLADVSSPAMFDLGQVMTDQVFSYGELGFQEVETSRYLVRLLRDSGFTVEERIAGIPTAFLATWGTGRPVISLGTDIDDIPQASQWPGIGCHSPMIEGAPGHGEGHNSGMAVNITAALAVRAVLRRERLPGQIRIWPGVAEELGGAKEIGRASCRERV